MTTDWNLVKKLKLLGFEENEARVYLASCEIGPSSMWNIYRKSCIKRTTCYQIFDRFIDKGIGSRTAELTHTMYSVVSPENLVTALEQKKNQFRDSLPLFDALTSKSPSKPIISLYEGLEGVRQVYYQGLQGPEGGERLVLANPGFWYQNPEENDAFVTERVKKKISLRMIFPDDKQNYKSLGNDRAEMRRTRFLPKDQFNPAVETQIYPNKVVFIAHSEKEPFATVIENPAIAQIERQKFELLWEAAKDKYE